MINSNSLIDLLISSLIINISSIKDNNNISIKDIEFIDRTILELNVIQSNIKDIKSKYRIN